MMLISYLATKYDPPSSAKPRFGQNNSTPGRSQHGGRSRACTCQARGSREVYRVVREMLPRERFGPDELLLWLVESQLRNEQARRSHERRRSSRREGRMEPPP